MQGKKYLKQHRLLQSHKKKIKLDKFSRRLATILSHRETQKNVLQQKKLEKSLEEKWKKTLNSKDNLKKLLQNMGTSVLNCQRIPADTQGKS